MKKFLVVLGVLVCAFALVSGDVFAFQEAFSVSGHRTQSRNATVGTIDAAYYNPAGLTKLQDGLFLDLGNRVLGLTTKTEVAKSPFTALGGYNTESKSSTVTYLLPNAAVAYKTGKAAVFYTFDIREGGAGGKWSGADDMHVVGTPLVAKMGNPTTGFTPWNLPADTLVFNGVVNSLDNIEMTTYTFGHTLGGAYDLTDKIAISGGLRYLKKTSDAKVEFKNGSEMKMLLNYEGYAGFVGLLVSPIEGLNLSAQYQGRSTKLGTTEDANKATSISPSVLYLGAGYKVMPELEVQFSYTCEFTKAWKKDWNRDWPYDDRSKNKQVFGLGAEYTVMPALIASAGVAYKTNDTSVEKNYDPTDPSFNEIDFGLGAVYKVMPNLSVEIGAAYNYYLESKGKSTDPTKYLGEYTHNRNAWVVGLGVSYKAL